MALKLMIQGTMSNVGKSILTAAFCRIFHQDGFRVQPFKSQNMALNSYVTKDGFEISRAQAMQAEAACVEPTVWNNPILLKPHSNDGSQIIVNGKPVCNMHAEEYFQYKSSLIPYIREAFDHLENEADIVIIEGAGSPVEMNLLKNDIVNMGIAKMFDSPVLLVGDIDRGGIYAQLFGTASLLGDSRQYLKGMLVNKFRGDLKLFQPAVSELNSLCGVPVLGIIPYKEMHLDDEDSLSERLESVKDVSGNVRIKILRLPHMTDFTDFSPLERLSNVSLSYVTAGHKLLESDLIILPGTEDTIGDLNWIFENELDQIIQKAHKEQIPVFGICGGYQILGDEIIYSEGTFAERQKGLGLLPVTTNLNSEKICRRTTWKTSQMTGILEKMPLAEVHGYEVRSGNTERSGGMPLLRNGDQTDGCQMGLVYGTNLHGIFDSDQFTLGMLSCISEVLHKSSSSGVSYETYRELQYNALADLIRQSVDMESVYDIIRKGV